MNSAPINIPVKREPAQVSIVLPEPVVQGNNHEMKASQPIWMVFALTLTEMILGSTIICFLFWMADGIGVGILLSLCFMYWLWHRNSRESKLIISGDYASMEEIERRYDLLERIAKYQYILANRQMDHEWEDMIGQGQLQLQDAINDTKVLDAQDESKYWKRKASEYDLHRQAEWNKEDEAPTVADVVEEKMSRWIRDVYQDTEPLVNQPWSKSGPWTTEEKEYVKAHIMPVVMGAAVPLFEVGIHTGNRARFNFQVYPSHRTAEEFMGDVWNQ